MSHNDHTSPLVSVVIPAYKARNYLEDALQSVSRQGYEKLEIIVVDDASPEPIDDIIKRYRELPKALPLNLIRHDKNQGIAAVRNTGIRAARGEYIALLDHDDLWKPDHVSDIVTGILETDSDIGFCSAMVFTGSPENWSSLWGPPNGVLGDNLALELFHASYVTPSSSVIKKSLLLEMNGFCEEPEFNACEDLDLWLRMAQRHAKFSYSKKPTVFYRNHSEQATTKTAYMACQAAYVRQSHLDKIPGPWFEKRSLIAASWWSAFNLTRKSGEFRFSLLRNVIVSHLFVPWQGFRIIFKIFGRRIFRHK